MPAPQPVTPSYRTQLRWAAGILVIQLLLQSYLLWSRWQGGFLAPSDGWLTAYLAAAWGLCIGLAIHAFWRGRLSRRQTFALYAVPALLLGLPALAYAASQDLGTPNPEDMLVATRYVRLDYYASPFVPLGCSEVRAIDLPELNRIFAERPAEEVSCFGFPSDGTLLSQVVPGWLADTGAKQASTSAATRRGSWYTAQARAELPLYRGNPQPTVPVRFAFAGMQVVNHAMPLSKAEQALLDTGNASVMVVYGDMEALRERLNP